MSKKLITSALSVLLVAMFCGALLWRCANILTIEGGPKDTLPPVILSVTPGDYSTDVSTLHPPRIYFGFDEYVQLKDQQKEFFTSPKMKKTPQVTMRGRGFVVTIKDTLLENTTYALNFGGMIVDNNEGNPLYGARYVFSTGPEVDSLVVSGYTEDSYKVDSVSKSFIFFYPADSLEDTPGYDSTMLYAATSARYKAPTVIGRAETNGIFITQNLKPIPYRIYAFEDTNNNMMYEASVDRIGFLDTLYNPAELPDFGLWYDSIRRYVTAEPQLYFRMFTDVAGRSQSLRQSSRPAQHKAILLFNAANPRIEKIGFDSIPTDRVIVDPLSPARDSIALWFDLPGAELPDTIKGEIIYDKWDDSLSRHVLDTAKLRLAWRPAPLSRDEEREAERVEKERERAVAAGEEWQAPEKPNTFAYKFSKTGVLTPETELSVTFDYPLIELDSAAITLTRQLERGESEVVPIRWRQDTVDMMRWVIEAPWRIKDKYTLDLPEGAFVDITRAQNDSTKVEYTGADPAQFAVFVLNVTGKSPEARYVVQMLSGAGTVLREVADVRSGRLQFDFVAPGEVKFRVIEDTNGNGRWDSGNLVERRQPERAENYVNGNGVDTFTTAENRDYEEDIDMNLLFAPVTMRSLSEMLDKREEARLQKEAEKRATQGNDTNNNNNNNNNRQGGSSMPGFGGAGNFMGGLR